MPPYINDFFRRSTPDYQTGYKEGFEDAKRAADKRLKKLIKELDGLEAFCTATSTTPSPEEPN